jgi:hypothetical protein
MNNEADVQRGAEALELLKNRDTGDVPAGLFDKVLQAGAQAPQRIVTDRRFWQGAGFGGLIAASLFAVALVAGWGTQPVSDAADVSEFVVTVGEPRNMDIAIETDRALQGATISILLSGGVELDGYASQRELTWVSDLDAGINRLSLPVLATNRAGGQMVVRLSHPDSEQVFVVRLKAAV